VEKSIAAKEAGAVALLMFNSGPGAFSFILTRDAEKRRRTVPTGTLSGVEGRALTLLANSTKLTVQFVSLPHTIELTT
jgi:hypothetical protein